MRASQGKKKEVKRSGKKREIRKQKHGNSNVGAKQIGYNHITNKKHEVNSSFYSCVLKEKKHREVVKRG